MSFDNHYPNRKDHRRPYHGSKAFDATCRNHGACTYCVEGRLHKHRRAATITEWDNPFEERDDWQEEPESTPFWAEGVTWERDEDGGIVWFNEGG